MFRHHMKINQTHHSNPEVIAITSYPNPGSGLYGPRDHFSAVSWHSERVLGELSKHTRILVVAESLPTYLPSFEVSKNLQVHRMWQKGNWLSFITLPFRILRFTSFQTVYVPFEFNVFGGIIPDVLLLFNLLVFRMCGKHIVFELHQVIWDVKKLRKHVYIHNRFMQWTINKGLPLFYTLVGLLSHHVVVLETALAKRLTRVVNPKKIHTLSIASSINPTTGLTKRSDIRNTLEYQPTDFILLVFGYINGYKGIDWIIHAMSHIPHQNIKLLIAGGPNPYLGLHKEYQAFYRNIIKLASKDKRIRTTGFVADDDIARYFAAADLVVLPYHVFMSASGPFSWALTCEKPVIISHALADYLQSPDMQSALSRAHVTSDEMIFPLRYDAFAKRISQIFTDEDLQTRLKLVSQYLNRSRSLAHVVHELYQLIATQTHNTIEIDVSVMKETLGKLLHVSSSRKLIPKYKPKVLAHEMGHDI